MFLSIIAEADRKCNPESLLFGIYYVDLAKSMKNATYYSA